MWSAHDLLDQVQELIGEMPGDFYNISSRLKLLNLAQNEMVRKTLALDTEATVALDADGVLIMPEDFLTFAKPAPQYVDPGGRYYPLKVLSKRQLDEYDPAWRSARTTPDVPKVLIEDESEFRVHPAPSAMGDVLLPYVPRPEPLTDSAESYPFNGVAKLQEFGIALAYYAANIVMLPRAPQVAGMYYNIYEQQLRDMRFAARNNAQVTRHARGAALIDWS